MYEGYVRLKLSDEELVEYYSQGYEFPDLYENQFVMVENKEGKLLDVFWFNGVEMKAVSYKPVPGRDAAILPRNLEQKLAFHMLQDRKTKVKVLSGGFGTGKDLLMLTHAVQELKKKKFDKIVYIRNNVEVRDTEKLGALPGSYQDKLLPYLMILADHLGGEKKLEEFISRGAIEPIHLGYLRGRDLRNSLIYCTEAQNLSVDHVQLLLGRVGEGSEIWFNGDTKAQVDRRVFKESSGMNLLIERLKGNPYFGYVHLVKSERSPIAALADLLD